jgi:aspartyl-tRNA(Asn)/glutamyl-tRNA(Gln) amidotransferase subunit A
MPNVLDCGTEVAPGSVDVLIHPTGRTPAPTHKQMLQASSIEHYINDVLTVPANLAGLPAISVPFGDTPSVGMQVWGQFGDDELVLSVARELLDHASTRSARAR